MDAQQYMDEIVDPTITEFETNPASRRHAFLACAVTFHTIDYLVHPKSSGNCRKSFREESADFALVDRVAHAFKHVQSMSPNQTPLKVENVLKRPPAVCGEMVAGLSRCGDASGGVTLSGNLDLDLLPVVKSAAEFLRGKIGKMGK